MLKFLSRSSNETKKFARLLAEEIFSQPPRISSALVLALTGNLGSGKTTFIQGFCKRTGIKKRITSPTFVIVKSYKLKVKSYKSIYHIDCYRIQKPKDLLNLGFKKITADSQNIILVEWAEKIRKILPKNTIWIKFFHTKNLNQRIIKIMTNDL